MQPAQQRCSCSAQRHTYPQARGSLLRVAARLCQCHRLCEPCQPRSACRTAARVGRERYAAAAERGGCLAAAAAAPDAWASLQAAQTSGRTQRSAHAASRRRDSPCRPLELPLEASSAPATAPSTSHSSGLCNIAVGLGLHIGLPAAEPDRWGHHLAPRGSTATMRQLEGQQQRRSVRRNALQEEKMDQVVQVAPRHVMRARRAVPHGSARCAFA